MFSIHPGCLGLGGPKRSKEKTWSALDTVLLTYVFTQLWIIVSGVVCSGIELWLQPENFWGENSPTDRVLFQSTPNFLITTPIKRLKFESFKPNRLGGVRKKKPVFTKLPYNIPRVTPSNPENLSPLDPIVWEQLPKKQRNKQINRQAIKLRIVFPIFKKLEDLILKKGWKEIWNLIHKNI